MSVPIYIILFKIKKDIFKAHVKNNVYEMVKANTGPRIKKYQGTHNNWTYKPFIKMTTNTPQTPRKTELKGAIPSAVRSSSIEHHSARFCDTERRRTS